MDNKSVALKLKTGLALVGFFLFAQSLNDPFHFDDALILNDANIANASHWFHFLNPLHLRQLTYFTFYLNHLVAGSNPASYHFVNVILHIANAVLFFILLDEVFERPLAFISAAIFLTHPLQTEAVMYVYQRSILLACFFSLLALIALRKDHWWFALLLFFLAFESKESALAVPLLVAVAYYLERPRRRPASAWLLIMVLVLSVTAVAILENQHEPTVGIGLMRQVSPYSYLLTETRVIYTYFRLLVFPFPQSLEYDFSWVRTLGPHTLLQIAGLLGLIGLGVYLARTSTWRITGFSIIAFFVLLTPTSTIIPSADAAFEHRLYLPMLAFAVFMASLAMQSKHPFRIMTPVLVVLAVSTFLRGTVWTTDVTLWEDTVRHVPSKARAWFNLGGAYLQSDPKRAEAAYRRAIELRPDFAEAYYDLGVIAQSDGNNREAVGYYEHAISLDAKYWPAWNNLGNTLIALGHAERAIQAFEMTLRLNPDHWPSQYNIAIVHFNSGRFAEAIPRLRTVLDWRPDFRDARYLLAVSLSRTGQRAEAESEWHKVGSTGGQPPMPTMIPIPAR